MRDRLFQTVIAFGGIIALGLAIITLALTPLTSIAPVQATVDMSWPNCDRLPSGQFSRVLVGVTGGLDFHTNNCAGTEATLANSYGLYINSGNPGFPRIKQLGVGPMHCPNNDLICYSYNYGYQSVIYAFRQAQLANLHSTEWWIDVESVNSWTSSKLANRADITGMLAAFGSVKFVHPIVGIYTAPDQWNELVGNWSVGLPLWLGTGDTTASDASHRCQVDSVTGVPVGLAQYTLTKQRLDYNIVCSAYKPMLKYF